MTQRSDIEKILADAYSARSKNDPVGSVAALHPDCKFRLSGNERLGGMTRMASGKAEIASAMAALCQHWDLSDFHTKSIHIDGDTAYVHRGGNIRFVPSGETITTELVDKFTFKDGKVVEFVEFIDTDLIARTAGM